MFRNVSPLLLKIRQYCHGANMVLVLLVLATMANSWLSSHNLNSSSQIQANLDFRVLDRKPDKYNRLIYFVWHKQAVWQLDSPKSLEIGQRYVGQGSLRTYDFSEQTKTFEQSARSLGIAGHLKLSPNFSQKPDCDAVCLGLQAIQSLRRYAENVYLTATCRDFRFIVQIFAPQTDCSDIFALSYGLVLGGTDKFSKELYQAVKTLGLTHLVAVSGFQVVLVITFLEALAMRLSIPRKWRLLVMLVGVLGLIVMVGPQPPVLRSGLSVMLSLSVLIFLGRKISSWRALIYSGLILLWFNPLYLNSASFQLSFLASLGLILASKRSDKTETTLEWLRNYQELSVTSLATFVMTLPIIIKISGQATLLAVVTNILVLPAIPVISLLNVLGLIPVLGSIPLALATFLQSLLGTLIIELARLPVATWLEVSWGNLGWGWLGAYYGFWLTVAFWYKNANYTANQAH